MPALNVMMEIIVISDDKDYHILNNGKKNIYVRI